MFKACLKTKSSVAQFLLRLSLGVVIFPHGAQKVFGWFGGPGFEKTIETFGGMGFPTWATVLLMVVEFPGAVLLIAGFLTRLWALGIGTSLTICMFMHHLQHGFFMNWFGLQKGEGFEYHLLAIGIALALILDGGGILSVDRALAPESDHREWFS